MTFGFDSAVACATDALDRLHTTAESHNRVMVLEVMGRYAGWIALYAGMAGGADVILIPEIPFTYESICAEDQGARGPGKDISRSSSWPKARGKRAADFVTSGGAGGQSRGAAGRHRRGRGGGNGEAHGQGNPRPACSGHLQRGGSPTTFDRALCSMFGATAVELIAAGEFGKMVAFTVARRRRVCQSSDAVGRLKTVPPEGNLIRTARALGISLGD